MKRALLALAALGGFGMAVFFYFKTSQSDQSAQARFDNGLRRLKQLDTTFSEAVLKVRFRLVDNYDEFPAYEHELDGLAAQLREVPGFVDATGHAAILKLLQGYSALLQKRFEMFEELKSQNAVLNNSLSYFPTTGEELMGNLSAEPGEREFQNGLNDFLRELLAYSLKLDESPAAVLRCIHWTEDWKARHSDHPDALLVASLLIHAKAILVRKPEVERLTRELVSLPAGGMLDEVSRIYESELARVLRQASLYRWALWILAAMIFLGITWVLATLRASNLSLENGVRERTAQLTSANTELQVEVAERQRAQSELIRISRLAGMAEVATSVLHNVGNVLNSINVSACSVVDKLKHSKAGNIAKVSALLNEHAEDLGHFLTQDSKGRQVPGYLGQLTQHLQEEKNAVLEELKSLTKNVDHVKDIIMMQQSHAKVSGVKETLKSSQLFEDAWRMNVTALVRLDIRFIRDYNEHAPAITVEKHKVLQILVNLIRNAKHACEETDGPEKSVTASIANGDGRVRLILRDNGVGIPPENLPRIFNHGFTTKKDGHGFGLHASALAAQEMGGSLTAWSDGPGKGATFTLELPA